MSRKQDTSFLEDLFLFAMRLPFWANILISAIAFIGLHAYSYGQIPQIVTPNHTYINNISAYYLNRCAFFGQYIIPGILLPAALAGWIRRRIKAKKFNRIATSASPATGIRNLTWQQFEVMIGVAFHKQGYSVQETGAGPDGGVDLILRKDSELFLVQCKQWRAVKVSVQIVRELYGVMSARGAAGGFVVTSGMFTGEAKKFANGTNVHLIDGQQLLQWFKSTRMDKDSDFSSSDAGPDDEPSLIRTDIKIGAPASPPLLQPIACPRCGGPMTTRTHGQEMEHWEARFFWAVWNFQRVEAHDR
jgi:restriction system protein